MNVAASPNDSTIGTDGVDTDGDGVHDCVDLCPTDATRITDVDTDNDGVLDCNDDWYVPSHMIQFSTAKAHTFFSARTIHT